jgi:hypothetical protein
VAEFKLGNWVFEPFPELKRPQQPKLTRND